MSDVYLLRGLGAWGYLPTYLHTYLYWRDDDDWGVVEDGIERVGLGGLIMCAMNIHTLY